MGDEESVLFAIMIDKIPLNYLEREGAAEPDYSNASPT